MVYGIGCDILEPARIVKSCKYERFKNYCFSKRELSLYTDDCRKLAGCFAAKEAFSKALGTGIRGFSLNEISVIRDELGKPYVEFSGRAAAIIESIGASAMVTLSDTESLVCAFVLLEVGNENNNH